MNTAVYEHLADEQGDRYLEYRRNHSELSEHECKRIFFSQRHEMELTRIIYQGIFADRIERGFHLSRRKQGVR